MTEEQIKVSVLLPTGDSVKTDFALSLAAALQMTGLRVGDREFRLVLEIINMRSSILPYARCALAQQALDSGADYAMLLDSDMKFPPHTIAQLVAGAIGHDAAVIGCTYSFRQQGYVRRTTAMQARDGEQFAVDPSKVTGTVEVGGIGTGVMLVRTDVFRRLAMPWFHFAWNDAGFMPEDTYFCNQARAAGFKILCDLDLSREIGHSGTFTFTLNEAADIEKVRSMPLDMFRSSASTRPA